MKVFISGGCKNGKSHYAQRLAQVQQQTKHADSLYYIATMKPVDAEDDQRINMHRKEREGWGFATIEQPVDIEKILDKCNHNHSFLLDSLTALLANEMFLSNGSFNEQASGKIINGMQQVLDKINNMVIVSDYIYSDAFLYEPLTEKYRKSLADIDQVTARNCDVVLEIAYSNIIVHRGKELFGGVYEKIS